MQIVTVIRYYPSTQFFSNLSLASFITLLLSASLHMFSNLTSWGRLHAQLHFLVLCKLALSVYLLNPQPSIFMIPVGFTNVTSNSGEMSISNSSSKLDLLVISTFKLCQSIELFIYFVTKVFNFLTMPSVTFACKHDKLCHHYHGSLKRVENQRMSYCVLFCHGIFSLPSSLWF